MDNNTRKGDAESWECSGLLERNSKDSESHNKQLQCANHGTISTQNCTFTFISLCLADQSSRSKYTRRMCPERNQLWPVRKHTH